MYFIVIGVSHPLKIKVINIKLKINISFKNRDMGKEETPTSNDLFSCL